jgi:hypothetical protein
MRTGAESFKAGGTTANAGVARAKPPNTNKAAPVLMAK